MSKRTIINAMASAGQGSISDAAGGVEFTPCRKLLAMLPSPQEAPAMTKDELIAHLIAAAPELLAVLKELQESAVYWSEYDVPLGIVDRINAVIDKATGGQP